MFLNGMIFSCNVDIAWSIMLLKNISLGTIILVKCLGHTFVPYQFLPPLSTP